MGSLSCPPMALNVQLYTGLSVQAKGEPLTKEAAGDKTKLEAGKQHFFVILLECPEAPSYKRLEYLSS